VSEEEKLMFELPFGALELSLVEVASPERCRVSAITPPRSRRCCAPLVSASPVSGKPRLHFCFASHLVSFGFMWRDRR
jgi:hypothetical protein